jgi:hypothetical protein
MTPHETKAQELARQIIRLHEYLSGAVKPSEKTITERIIRHFPEPQNEYNCPPVCSKCNQHHVGVCEPVESACEWTAKTKSGLLYTSCGHENWSNFKYKFCPYCGGKIKV